jgi:hypothetical protein
MSAKRIRAGIGDHNFYSYNKISAVRNPFDRLVSLFHFKSKQLNRVLPSNKEDLYVEFKKFVQGKWPSDYEVTHICDSLVVDHVIRFESLHEDFKSIVSKLSLPIDVESLPFTKMTKSDSRKSADYYDDETVAIVNERMSWVFNIHDYPRDPRI